MSPEFKEQFEDIEGGVVVRAPAKINLSLLIAGKREDGFHEIETVMAKVNWYDELLIERIESGIELFCEGPYWAPEGPENLVWRACRRVFDEAGVEYGVRFTLRKNIPAGTGLGSASSDCAAAVMGLDRLFDLGLSRGQQMRIGGELGSDVPFFMGGPVAYCTGRGEKIDEKRCNFFFKTILLLPDVTVSTKKVYENYHHDEDEYRRLHGEISQYIAENRIDLLGSICENMLAASCFDLYPRLSDLKSRSGSLGPGRVCLSGSGSAMYCMVTDVEEHEIEDFQSMLRERMGCESLLLYSNRW
ncbi:4-diphosphocytidyl-2-C-methyl-D-erythritol kinase [Anaerohalosphaera lusitana]|uniref:4-diphosphocytidyl-2-C-methyl-D-erythritol kinase n=2 Tax=Anaerohalosphaera lusitana TaxID=1936003 RepID=A0A1U9NPB9_9BACT|nr:4-diphosphocytidyl-2-C-methyl-D-erythritol kinase [Anaerohalosphaera lusitana]